MSVELLPFQKLVDLPDLAQRHRRAISGLAIASSVLISIILCLLVTALISGFFMSLYTANILFLFVGIPSMAILLILVCTSSCISLRNTNKWAPTDVCCNLMRSHPTCCTKSCAGNKHCCARMSCLHTAASVWTSLFCVLLVVLFFAGCSQSHSYRRNDNYYRQYQSNSYRQYQSGGSGKYLHSRDVGTCMPTKSFNFYIGARTDRNTLTKALTASFKRKFGSNFVKVDVGDDTAIGFQFDVTLTGEDANHAAANEFFLYELNLDKSLGIKGKSMGTSGTAAGHGTRKTHSDPCRTFGRFRCGWGNHCVWRNQREYCRGPSEKTVKVGTRVTLIADRDAFQKAFNAVNYVWDDSMTALLGQTVTVVDRRQPGIFGLPESKTGSGQSVWWYPFSVIACVNDTLATDGQRSEHGQRSAAGYREREYETEYETDVCGVLAAFEVPALILMICLVATTATSAWLLRKMEQGQPDIELLPAGKMVVQACDDNVMMQTTGVVGDAHVMKDETSKTDLETEQNV